MKRAALTLALLMLSLAGCDYLTHVGFITKAKAQDTYVPTGLKSSCEWMSGETCVPRARHRPRPRVVVIPKVTYKPYRVVPEHLVPLAPKREAEVRGWRREWERRDRDRHLRERDRCWPVRMEAQSDEKIARDGKAEAIRRWSGVVRAKLGELYMDFKNAVDKRELCWQSSTGERMTDKITGGNERCMVEARPCRAERTKESDDE